MGIVLIKWSKSTLMKWAKNLLNGTIILGEFFPLVFLKYHFFYFSFIFISSENFSKSDLSSRFSEMCPTYKSTFVDVDWINRDCNQLIADFENVLTDAIHNTSVPVGEALISFIGEQAIMNHVFIHVFFRRTNGWKYSTVRSILLRGFAQWGWQFW